MRFGTIDDRLVLVRDGRALDVGAASRHDLPSDVNAALARWDEVLAWGATASWDAGFPVTEDELGPPVPHPRQVFAVALNYAPHAAEAGFEPPEAPLVFTKFPTSIAGPVSTVTLPDGNVDWEVELVTVVGRGGRDITRADAWDALAGITLGQDLSERLLQSRGKPPQFSLGKSHAGFAPIGPHLVTTDELPDRDDLAMSCAIDGEEVQKTRTSHMIFDVPELVAQLSAVCELLPGDLIFTGTPEGVGNRRTPQRFLQPGETLVSTLEGVGEIRQTFVR